jgi:hypothetical protein
VIQAAGGCAGHARPADTGWRNRFLRGSTASSQAGVRYKRQITNHEGKPSSPQTSGPGTARPRAGPRHQGIPAPPPPRYRSGVQ